VPSKHRIVAGLAALSLAAAPAAAYAQNGAGDQQYQDPFGNGGQTTPAPKKPQSTPSSGSGLTQAPPTASSPSAGASPSQVAPSGPAPAPAPAAAARQLPRTGLDVRILVGAGLALVAAGVALRRQLGDGRR
jgi:hypothetical protein